MRYELESSCAITFDGVDATVVSPRGPLRIRSVNAGQRAALELLRERASSLVELRGQFDADDDSGAPWIESIIDRLVGLGFVCRVVGAQPLIRTTVTAARHQRGSYVYVEGDLIALDRFAYLHGENGTLVLESPRAFCRIELVDERSAMLVAGMARPVSALQLSTLCNLPIEDVRDVLAELVNEGFASLDAEERVDEWHEWSLPDAIFHSRSRSGRHGNAYGATYSRASERSPLPAVRPQLDGEKIELMTGDLSKAVTNDPPFASVLEARQSWRMPGLIPLHVNELGEFLFRTSRVRGRRGTEREEVSNRPYPGGGADYELEIYVLAHRVDGLARGLYSYDPLEHVLTTVTHWSSDLDLLATDVAGKTGIDAVPDAALLVTARMQRLTYKYESIPYAVALKDLGALYATWYLAATAMGLAPCAIGGGDSELLAHVNGIPAFLEPRIGEFILNKPHPDEIRGPLPPARVFRLAEGD